MVIEAGTPQVRRPEKEIAVPAVGADMREAPVARNKARWLELLLLTFFVLFHAALLAAAGFLYMIVGTVAILSEGDGGHTHVRLPAAPTLKSSVEHMLLKLLLLAAVYSIFAPLFRRRFDLVAIAGSVLIVLSIVTLGAINATAKDPSRLLGLALLLCVYAVAFVPALLATVMNARKNRTLYRQPTPPQPVA